MKAKTKRPRGRKAVPLTFTYEVQMVIPGHAPPMLRQAVNMAHIGYQNCNVRNKAGVLVTRPGVTKAQERKLEDAHWAINRAQGITLTVTRDLLTGEVHDVVVKPWGA
jgi:hypothetical protein